MGYSRRLLPQQTHSVTRRAAGRCFWLRPDAFTNGVILYAIGRASQLNPSVDLHAFVAESNHTHSNLTDTRREDTKVSELSRFFQSLNRLIAAALNTRYGRGENLWAPESFDNTEVHGQQSLEQQLLYLWTNPVKDGLVERPEDWPGVIFLPEDFGKTFKVQKPSGAFFGGRRPDAWTDLETCDDWRAELAREEEEALALLGSRRKSPARPRRDRSKLPEFVEFTIKPPPGYEHLSLEEVRSYFRELLDAEVERIHARRRAANKARFLGVDAVLAQDPRASAGGTWPSFKINPRIACRGDNARRLSLLVGLREWREAYRTAYHLWSKGRPATFPPGTYAPGLRVWTRAGPATSPRVPIGLAA